MVKPTEQNTKRPDEETAERIIKQEVKEEVEDEGYNRHQCISPKKQKEKPSAEIQKTQLKVPQKLSKDDSKSSPTLPLIQKTSIPKSPKKQRTLDGQALSHHRKEHVGHESRSDVNSKVIKQEIKEEVEDGGYNQHQCIPPKADTQEERSTHLQRPVQEQEELPQEELPPPLRSGLRPLPERLKPPATKEGFYGWDDQNDEEWRPNHQRKAEWTKDPAIDGDGLRKFDNERAQRRKRNRLKKMIQAEKAAQRSTSPPLQDPSSSESRDADGSSSDDHPNTEKSPSKEKYRPEGSEEPQKTKRSSPALPDAEESPKKSKPIPTEEPPKTKRTLFRPPPLPKRRKKPVDDESRNKVNFIFKSLPGQIEANKDLAQDDVPLLHMEPQKDSSAMDNHESSATNTNHSVVDKQVKIEADDSYDYNNSMEMSPKKAKSQMEKPPTRLRLTHRETAPSSDSKKIPVPRQKCLPHFSDPLAARREPEMESHESSANNHSIVDKQVKTETDGSYDHDNSMEVSLKKAKSPMEKAPTESSAYNQSIVDKQVKVESDDSHSYNNSIEVPPKKAKPSISEEEPPIRPRFRFNASSRVITPPLLPMKKRVSQELNRNTNAVSRSVEANVSPEDVPPHQELQKLRHGLLRDGLGQKRSHPKSHHRDDTSGSDSDEIPFRRQKHRPNHSNRLARRQDLSEFSPGIYEYDDSIEAARKKPPNSQRTLYRPAPLSPRKKKRVDHESRSYVNAMTCGVDDSSMRAASHIVKVEDALNSQRSLPFLPGFRIPKKKRVEVEPEEEPAGQPFDDPPAGDLPIEETPSLAMVTSSSSPWTGPPRLEFNAEFNPPFAACPAFTFKGKKKVEKPDYPSVYLHDPYCGCKRCRLFAFGD